MAFDAEATPRWCDETLTNFILAKFDTVTMSQPQRPHSFDPWWGVEAEGRCLNVNAILRLADKIEGSWWRKFDMRDWRHCISGYASRMLGVDHRARRAAEILGLTDKQEDELFTPDLHIGARATRHHAAATLRRLAHSGVVEWRLPPRGCSD